MMIIIIIIIINTCTCNDNNIFAIVIVLISLLFASSIWFVNITAISHVLCILFFYVTVFCTISVHCITLNSSSSSNSHREQQQQQLWQQLQQQQQQCQQSVICNTEPIFFPGMYGVARDQTVVVLASGGSVQSESSFLLKLPELSFPLLFSLGLIIAVLFLLAFPRFSLIKSRE